MTAATNSTTLPATIGRYQIKGEAGHGGMGAVYRAYDPHFERDVAIKVLPQEYMNDPVFKTRFEREAKTIASLDHPAVVPVYDFGREGDQPYLVMRFMSGGTLADRLKKGPFTPENCLETVQRLCRALDEVHKQGIVHRDIKPSNVLFDRYGHAYLSDFGMVRLTNTDMTITGSNMALGTPGYMSPEQIQGLEATIKSDVYALGIMIFEMLTGKNPFKSDTPAMTLVRQMTYPLPHLYDILPNLPPQYDTIIRRALAASPSERPSTVSSLANDLAAAMAARQTSPVSEAKPTPQPPMKTPIPAPLNTVSHEITCPFCEHEFAADEKLNLLTCPYCQHDFLLQGHLCPTCNTYHDQQTAVCSECVTPLSRICAKCNTGNWSGNDRCKQCGTVLAPFSLTHIQTLKTAIEREQEHAQFARQIKTQEEEASKKRMADLRGQEEKRLEDLHQYRTKQRQQETYLFALIGFVVLIFILLLIWYFNF